MTLATAIAGLLGYHLLVLAVDWWVVIQPLMRQRDEADRFAYAKWDQVVCWSGQCLTAERDRDALRQKSDDLSAKLQEAEDIIAALRQHEAEVVAEVEALRDTVRALEAALASSEAELAGCRAERDEARQCDSIAMAHIDKFEAAVAIAAADRDAWRERALLAERLKSRPKRVGGRRGEVG